METFSWSPRRCPILHLVHKLASMTWFFGRIKPSRIIKLRQNCLIIIQGSLGGRVVLKLSAIAMFLGNPRLTWKREFLVHSDVVKFCKKGWWRWAFFWKKVVRFDNQSIWCTCHLISNVSDGYNAMDDIPEEDVINIIEDHVKGPAASSTTSKTNEFSAQGSYSVVTVKTFHTPASRAPTAAVKY